MKNQTVEKKHEQTDKGNRNQRHTIQYQNWRHLAAETTSDHFLEVVKPSETRKRLVLDTKYQWSTT